MRILHLSTRLILGGSQENTVLSCEGQARLGHGVHLGFGPIYGPEGSLLERVQGFRTDEGRGIETHVVPHMVREVNPVSDARCLRELRGLIERLKPDVVHTHSSKAGILGRIAAHQARERGVKTGIVHTIHGPPFMPVEGGGLAKLKVRVNNAIYTAAERYAAQRCDVIVSVADAMTREFLRRGIGRPELYTTVYSGMETQRYLQAGPGESPEEMRAALGLGAEEFVIGTVARLAQHKGHDDLLEALAGDLKARREWTLLWVGDGWWRTRLIERARALGLDVAELDRGQEARGASLVITGLVPPERVAAHIRAMDVLAHPSYREGLPRTVPQALLCSVPPVAYDADGTGEICRNMDTGRLVGVGDRAGLREAIEWMASHERERTVMAARGREECAEKFSVDRMVRELERVYAIARERAGV